MKTLTLATRVWRYDETACLGSPGGFATVYSGLSTDGSPVAIKIFHSKLIQDAHRELQFASTRLGKATSHVIAIHDCGTDAASGQPAIVMARGEYSLSQFIRDRGPLTESEACTIACAIVDGLIEVSDWVHRDLKPANVIWCDASWRLVDFGIARIADASTAVGTMKDFLSAHYAAPEQWNSEHATHATDIYALGCIIHELLTGKTLFDGTTQADLARQHRLMPAPITAGSPALQSLLHSMLAKHQKVRPDFPDIRRQLTKLSSASRMDKRPASALATISAAVSEEQARREAAIAQAQHATHARGELREHASRVLKDIQTELFERIAEDAPAAIIKNVGGPHAPVMQASLAQGTLTMSVGHMRDVRQGAFPISGWDAISWDYIKCENDGYDRSASLWYVDDGSGVWRWLEAAYFCWGGNSGVNEPCALPPDRDADIAASKTMGKWRFAHSPRPVDEFNRESFIDRWINYLVLAAQGQLRRPSGLPES